MAGLNRHYVLKFGGRYFFAREAEQMLERIAYAHASFATMQELNTLLREMTAARRGYKYKIRALWRYCRPYMNAGDFLGEHVFRRGKSRGTAYVRAFQGRR